MGDPALAEKLVTEKLDDLLTDHPPEETPTAEFLGLQFDAGLAWVHFPEGQGGLGVSHKLQRTVNERLSTAGAPNPFLRNPIGYANCAPTLVNHGSPVQTNRYLRPLFTGEEIWCQLFSEPTAGSDLASLASRARRDGDEWALSGQKVWTTLAHVAKWGIVLARSDPEQDKHAGITCFIVDMTAPGVDVRPLRQMTGEAEFNEVFLDDVRVGDDARLGPEGQGWRVAMTTLMNERVAMGGTSGRRKRGPMGDALAVWERRVDQDPVRRDAIVRLWIKTEVARMTRLRAAQNRARGAPGPEESVVKLMIADLNKSVYAGALSCMGADGMLYDSYTMTRPDNLFTSEPSVQKAFLRAQANSIEGGTSDIMRNVLGERALGLPPEPRVDKGIAWSQLPRNL